MGKKQPKLSDIRFPAGGLVRRYGFQHQPPYTTADCMNVRPYDTLEGRERGGSRPGMAKSFDEELESGADVQLLRSVSSVSTTGTVSNILFAAAGGVPYHSVAGDMTAISATLNATAKVLRASQHGLKLYIADYRATKVSGTDGTIASTNQLSATSVADWTALGIDTALDVALVVGSVDAEADTYAITEVTSGYLVVNGTLTDGSFSWEIGRKIKVYNPATGGIASIVATYGIPPLGCPLICTYRDRLVLAGPDQVWYMSAQGDPTDYDYGGDPEDEARAVAGSSSDAGEIGEPITALVPHSDDYLIFGCANSLWLLRGDPASGGQIDALSRNVGIVAPDAWCNLPDGSLLFLGQDGIYQLPAGASNYPIAFSRDPLPADLVDVDTTNNTVSMIYDVTDRGVHLFISPKAGTQGTHWWIDWALKSFWPFQVPATMQPNVVTSYAATPAADKVVLLGGQDGYIREFRASATSDDSTAITSYIDLGPISLGEPGSDGILTEIAADLGTGSATVTWKVHAGDTSEECADSTVEVESGSWSAGDNTPEYPRVAGVAVKIELASTGRWSVENMTVGRIPGGRKR